MGTAEQYALTITVDERTNSLLVAGTREYVELCSDIISELDASPAQERLTQVYRLRNARAGDIEKAVKDLLDQEREKLVSTLGEDAVGAAQRLLEREVAVVSVASDGEEENANTLLISASPRYFDIVVGLIRELDQPPPQVLIQVLLAEVRLDDTTDFGIDWTVFGSHNSSTGSMGTDYGIDAEINAFGGFSVQVTGGDLNLFLRALQSQGRTELLSRPQILASDNQKAEIKIAQRVPIVTSSQASEDLLSTFTTVRYESVGIILNVTPRINPDGSVRMEVKPEVSNVDESTVQISPGVNAIVLNERSAETTVTVQDGHTIIIGGLITTEDEEIIDKVPFLGDIPLLGHLFRKTTTIEQRRELLIILTPHVIRGVEDADKHTNETLEHLRLLGSAPPPSDLLKREALRPLKDGVNNSTQFRVTPQRRRKRIRPGKFQRVAPLDEPTSSQEFRGSEPLDGGASAQAFRRSGQLQRRTGPQRPVPLYLLPDYQQVHRSRQRTAGKMTR